MTSVATKDGFVVEVRVLVESISPSADAERVREMVVALEATAKDYGGALVINEVRWLRG